MNNLPINLGTSPNWQADDSDITKPGSLFTGMTYFEILGYVIGNLGIVFDPRGAPTGYVWTIDALGTQDDGVISAVVPTQLTEGGTQESILYPNRNNSSRQNFASFICAIMESTNCRFRSRDGMAFKVIYPQESDAVNETYYSNGASGHVFYEAHDIHAVKIPNMVQVYGGFNEATGGWDNSGVVYDSDTGEYTGANYTGIFGRMPSYHTDDRLTSDANCTTFAGAQLNNATSQTLSGRLTIPFDPTVELFDRVAVFDTRGS
jgi:hypothetical protein